MPFFAMIPKADGDSTPLGQLPLSVLPVVYRWWWCAETLVCIVGLVGYGRICFLGLTPGSGRILSPPSPFLVR